MSVSMLACSTHGRVPSALRTRSGQPCDQYMPGTWSVTSRGGAMGLSSWAMVPLLGEKKARIERIKKRSMGLFPGNDFAAKPLLGDRLHHLFGGHLARVEAHLEPIAVQVHVDPLNARKP